MKRKIQDLLCLIVMMSAELDYLRGTTCNNPTNDEKATNAIQKTNRGN